MSTLKNRFSVYYSFKKKEGEDGNLHLFNMTEAKSQCGNQLSCEFDDITADYLINDELTVNLVDYDQDEQHALCSVTLTNSLINMLSKEEAMFIGAALQSSLHEVCGQCMGTLYSDTENN